MELSRPALEFNATQAVAAAGPHTPVKVDGVLIPHLILGNNETLTNTEKLQALRSRFRGIFTTTSVADFCGYVRRRRNEYTLAPLVFVDGAAMQAKAFFNVGSTDTPGHGDDVGTLALPKTGPFAALWDILDERIDQKKLAEFLEDWRDHLRAFSEFDEEAGLNPMPLGRAIAAVRNVTVESRQQQDSAVSDFSANRTALESVEARSQHVLPPYLEFEAEPYMELPRRRILLRLSVITAPAIGFVLRIVREPDVLEAIAQDFKELLAAGLKEDAVLHVGSFTQAP